MVQMHGYPLDCYFTLPSASPCLSKPQASIRNVKSVVSWEEEIEGYGKGAGFGTFYARALYTGRMLHLQVPVRRAKSCNKERLLLLDKHHNRRRNLTLPLKDTLYSLHMTASRFTTNWSNGLCSSSNHNHSTSTVPTKQGRSGH